VFFFRHWLYGDKVVAAAAAASAASTAPADSAASALSAAACGDVQSPARVRGWFPRKCAVELADNLQTDDDAAEASGGKKKESKKVK
jgi:hypothetical protein